MSGNIIPLSLRFLWMFLVLTIGLALFAGLLGISSAATSFIPFWMAAMDGGTRFHHRTGRRPASGEAWQLAGLYTAIAFIITAPLVYLILRAAPDMGAGVGLFTAIVAGLVAFMLLIGRVFVWLGGRNAAKVAEKKAQKEARDAVKQF